MTSQKERKKIEEFIRKAKEFMANEIPKRKKECEKNGHKDFYWHRYVVTSQSSYSDKVHGMCRYCWTSLERSLNEEECNDIRRFWKSMREPMTI